VLLLDDVFSGLDAHSEDRIFTRLLGREGLLRGSGATILLATHAAHRLSYADKIVALNSQGSVSEQGTFSDLMKTGGYTFNITTRHTKEAEHKQIKDAQLVRDAGLDDSTHTNAVNDLTRSVGDLQVYKYYFASVGYGNAALFLALMASHAVFFRSSGMLRSTFECGLVD